MTETTVFDLFQPPEGLVGWAGWICGLSASSQVLDEIAERFTTEGTGARAARGLPRLGLILDPDEAYIPPNLCHGVVHCRYDGSSSRPFQLMHAKVALLGFRHPKQPENWRLRLIISTGNWTRETANDSIDLFFTLEVGPDDSNVQAYADIFAASGMMTWLRMHFDTRLLDDLKQFHSLREWCDVLKMRARGVEPRFVDTRKEALLDLVLKRVNQIKAVRRNLLVIGSGFFEGGDIKPENLAPMQIRKRLQESKLLTQDPYRWLVVEPERCQIISCEAMFNHLHKEGWNVLRPAQTKKLHRRLHAKFIFSANVRENRSDLTSDWTYIGSGNVTRPGFLQSAKQGGHLEAGIVFTAGSLCWPGDEAEGLTDIQNLLPINPDNKLEKARDLKPGESRVPSEGGVVAPPVSCVVWDEAGPTLHLDKGERATGLEVLGPDETLCDEVGGGWKWPSGARPALVQVRFEYEAERRLAPVPVKDQFGRIAAQNLPARTFETLFDTFTAFPLLPQDDFNDGESSAVPVSEGLAEAAHAATSDLVRSPIRAATALIEQLADRQMDIAPDDWAAWCTRLETAFAQVERDDPIVAGLHKTGMNPLSVLRKDPFLPPEIRSKHALLKTFDETLTSIERSWGLDELEIL